MSGHGAWSGQGARPQKTRGSDGMGGGTQSGHAAWGSASDIASTLGVSDSKARDYWDAINGDEDGGFTWGWDSNIRKYQNGASQSEITSDAKTRQVINDKFNGSESAYMAELRKKANNCESLIDASPKWNGGELSRGYLKLSPSTLAELTTVGNVVDLNAGTASWTTSSRVSNNFAHYYGGSAPSGSLVAHVVSGKRRGTSVKGLSHFQSENEILCSKREAFECLRVVRKPNGEVHAYYRVVSTDMDWDKYKNK